MTNNNKRLLEKFPKFKELYEDFLSSLYYDDEYGCDVFDPFTGA